MTTPAKLFKTITDNLTPSTARKGEAVTITGGAFAGWSGIVVDFDGIWRTVKCTPRGNR